MALHGAAFLNGNKENNISETCMGVELQPELDSVYSF